MEPRASHIKSEAVLRIAAGLPQPLPALAGVGLALPRPLRDALYDAVANNRYTLFGRTPSCRLSEPRFAERFLAD